jgi:hypothetical protein
LTMYPGNAGRLGPQPANRERPIGKAEKTHKTGSARPKVLFFSFYQEHQFNRLDSLV